MILNVAVTWSVTIETEAPSPTDAYCDPAIHHRIIDEAWPQVQKKDGYIETMSDIEEVEL